MSDSPRELSVTTLIDAAPGTVWRVMTERMAEWWCPKPWTVTLDEVDLRSGGRCAMTMHGPDGEVKHSITTIFRCTVPRGAAQAP